MTDFLPIYIVIKTFIIFFVIGHCCHLVTEQPYRNLLHIVLDALAKCLLQLLHPFLGIEDCRLIHVIPEALNALIDQITIMVSKPFSCLRIEHIRKMRITRPYCCRKITAVLTFTEIIVFHAFLIHRIALFHLDSGINDRYKANSLLFHPLHKIRKIRKLLFIEREVLIILHIVNVHINHIQWNLIFAITLRYILKILSCLIAPAALTQSKRKFRRNIASSDQLTELFYDVIRVLSLNDIQIQVCRLTAHLHRVFSCISNIKYQSGRIIKKQTHILFSGNHNQIVRTIQGALVLRMFRIICTVTDITVTSFIQSTVGFSQTIYHIILCKTVSKRKSLLQRNFSIRRCSLFCLYFFYDCLCLKRISKHIFAYHIYFSSCYSC